MNRAEISQQEAQRDPIFILRRRRFWLADDAPYSSDGDSLLDRNNNSVSEEEVVSRGHGHHYMEADRVFLTRQEGEVWGRSQAHNIGMQHINWDIYCVSAEMSLAELLRESDAATDNMQIARAMEFVCVLSESGRKRLIAAIKTTFGDGVF